MALRTFSLASMALAACDSPAPKRDAAPDTPRDAHVADRPDDVDRTDRTDVADVADAAVDDGPPDGGPPDSPGVAVTTFHYDLQRTGANRAERRLTPANVRPGSFGRDPAFAPSLDGHVYGQPLYLPRVSVGGGDHAVLYVATQANSVYALDARTGATLWRTNVGPAVPLARMPCGNVGPTTGIVSTPVIDPDAGTLYAVAYTSLDGGGTRFFTISALDVATGVQRARFPARIAPPPSNGSTFDPSAQGQRGALALERAKVYVPFGGLHNDCGFFHGWVVGVDTTDPSSQSSFATPGSAAGIWSYGGPAGDGEGNLFVATGNGRTPESMGEHVIRLNTRAAGLTYGRTTADYFTPSDRARLDGGDIDLNTVQPMVLPDHVGSRTPHLLFQGAKTGVGYLLDRDNLGGPGRGDGIVGEGVYSAILNAGGTYGAAAAWSDGRELYVFAPSRGPRYGGCGGRGGGSGGGVLVLRLRTDSGGSAFARTWCTEIVSNPNAPTISSNGNAAGLLWLAGTTPPELRVYDLAEGVEIYRATGPDAPSTVRQWTPPVVVDGRVYVTGHDTVYLYAPR